MLVYTVHRNLSLEYRKGSRQVKRLYLYAMSILANKFITYVKRDSLPRLKTALNYASGHVLELLRPFFKNLVSSNRAI